MLDVDNLQLPRCLRIASTTSSHKILSFERNASHQGDCFDLADKPGDLFQQVRSDITGIAYGFMLLSCVTHQGVSCNEHL